VFLLIEKSTLAKPGPLKMLRPLLPNVPFAGGVNVPTIVEFAGETEIVIEIIERVRKSGLQDENRIHLVALQQLRETFAPGNFIRRGERETMTNIEIAVSAFRPHVQAVLRAEVPVAAGFIPAVTSPRVTRGETPQEINSNVRRSLSSPLRPPVFVRGEANRSGAASRLQVRRVT
jgi:hypothetical protein